MAQLYVVYDVKVKTSKYGNLIYEISIIENQNELRINSHVEVIASPLQQLFLPSCKTR